MNTECLSLALCLVATNTTKGTKAKGSTTYTRDKLELRTARGGPIDIAVRIHRCFQQSLDKKTGDQTGSSNTLILLLRLTKQLWRQALVIFFTFGQILLHFVGFCYWQKLFLGYSKCSIFGEGRTHALASISQHRAIDQQQKVKASISVLIADLCLKLHSQAWKNTCSLLSQLKEWANRVLPPFKSLLEDKWMASSFVFLGYLNATLLPWLLVTCACQS